MVFVLVAVIVEVLDILAVLLVVAVMEDVEETVGDRVGGSDGVALKLGTNWPLQYPMFSIM